MPGKSKSGRAAAGGATPAVCARAVVGAVPLAFAEPPYAVGFLLLCAVTVAAAAAAFAIWARWARLPPVLAAAFVCAGLGSLPLLRTLVLGQHSAVMLLALTASVIWSLQGRDARAGVALAAATLYLIILVPLAWLLQRRWRALVAGAASLAALTALSVAVMGPHVLADFVTIESAFEQYFPGAEAVEQMQNWRGLLELTLGWQGVGEQMIEGVLLLLTATVVVWAWWPGGAQVRRAVDLRWALTILASLLFTYHLHLNDLLAWAIPAAIGLRRVYAPPEGAALGLRARQVTLVLVWGAWVVPWLAFFAEGARPGLWFMLIVERPWPRRSRGSSAPRRWLRGRRRRWPAWLEDATRGGVARRWAGAGAQRPGLWISRSTRDGPRSAWSRDGAVWRARR